MFVIIGTTTADLLVVSRQATTDSGGDGFRSSNVTLTETPARVLVGGNGGISAYVLAGFGARVALCSAVGQDQLGRVLADHLRARKVNLEGLIHSGTCATSTSVIIMADVASQTVFHHVGSSAQLRYEDMPERLFTECEVLLASSFPLMSGMRAGGLAQALRTTHRAGGITALDIGPALGDPVTLSEIAALLCDVDYLIGNAHEIEALTGSHDCEAGGRELQEAGARHVVIKRGADGASLRGEEGPVDVPGFTVDANISVGAGDAFNAGFLYGVWRKWSYERAMRYGCAVAALMVSGEQGVMDAPTSAEVEAFLATRA